VTTIARTLPGARPIRSTEESTCGMDVTALAALAGNALVTAAVTDAWEDVRHKKIFGRGRPDPQIEKRFDATRAALETARSAGEAERARAEQAASWNDELDELVREIRGSAGVASGHAVAAGRDVNITAGAAGWARA
jgi:hypothetical protein